MRQTHRPTSIARRCLVRRQIERRRASPQGIRLVAGSVSLAAIGAALVIRRAGRPPHPATRRAIRVTRTIAVGAIDESVTVLVFAVRAIRLDLETRAILAARASVFACLPIANAIAARGLRTVDADPSVRRAARIATIDRTITATAAYRSPATKSRRYAASLLTATVLRTGFLRAIFAHLAHAVSANRNLVASAIVGAGVAVFTGFAQSVTAAVG